MVAAVLGRDAELGVERVVGGFLALAVGDPFFGLGGGVDEGRELEVVRVDWGDVVRGRRGPQLDLVLEDRARGWLLVGVLLVGQQVVGERDVEFGDGPVGVLGVDGAALFGEPGLGVDPVVLGAGG